MFTGGREASSRLEDPGLQWTVALGIKNKRRMNETKHNKNLICVCKVRLLGIIVNAAWNLRVALTWSYLVSY